MSGAAIGLEQVAFRYTGSDGPLDMVFDLTIPAGEIVAVIGPSGAGKSTLLSLIAGFDAPQSGRVLIGGSDVTRLAPAGRPVSMLFQDNNLFTHLDVETNVALGVSPGLRLSADDRARVANAIERVGLKHLARRLPRDLSGGERQRAALARVLVRDRPVLLLDEPFAALGPALRRDMLGLVKDLQRDTGATVVMVTHMPQDAKAIAGWTVFIDRGRVAAFRPTAELFASRDIPALTDYLG